MRTSFYLAVAVSTLVATQVFAMGGGGGGGYGGMNAMPSASFDDYATAKRLIKHQQYADAIPHLEKALAKHPHDADVFNYLGYTHRMVGVSEAQSEPTVRAAVEDGVLAIVHDGARVSFRIDRDGTPILRGEGELA